MTNSKSIRLITVTILALVIFSLGYRVWEVFKPTPDATLKVSIVNNNKSMAPPLSGRAETPRPIKISLPMLGEISGARWIPNQQFRNPQAKYAEFNIVTLDILVDENGRFLAAMSGDDAFSTIPTPERYHEVLSLLLDKNKSYGIAPPELVARVMSVKLEPVTLGDKAMVDMMWQISAGIGMKKYGVWYNVAVEYQGETHPRMVLIHTWNNGLISEKSGKMTSFIENLGAGYIPFDSPAVPGANRYGTNTGIKAYQINGDANQKRYVSEPWAGLSPWKDEELDPKYGELLPNELSVPIDRTILTINMQGALGAGSRPEIKQEVKDRLEREAAEKSATKGN